MEVVFALVDEAEALRKEAQTAKKNGHLQDAYFFFTSSFHLYLHAVNECQEEELAEIKKKIQELAKSTLISCEAVRSHVVSASAGTSVTGVKRDLCKEAKSPEDDLHMSNKEKEEVDLKNWLKRKIVKSTGGPGFSGVVGLQHLKRLLETSLLIVTDQEWSKLLQSRGVKVHGRHVLLFGLPGTGKSLIVRAFHQQAKGMNLLELSVTDVTSRYYGDGEAALNAAFKVAEEHAPCILFLDEIDGVFGSSGKPSGNTAIINQFLTLSENCKGVQVFAATNRPWMLEPAFRRRFAYTVHVPLPNSEERKRLILSHLQRSNAKLPEEHLASLAKASKGMSGSDIAKMVDDAIEGPLRKIQTARYFKKVLVDGHCFWSSCEASDPEAERKNYTQITPSSLLFSSPTVDDFEKAMRRVKKTTDVEKEMKQPDSLLRKTLEFLQSSGQCGRSGVPKLHIVEAVKGIEGRLRLNNDSFPPLEIVKFKRGVPADMLKEASTQTEVWLHKNDELGCTEREKKASRSKTCRIL